MKIGAAVGAIGLAACGIFLATVTRAAAPTASTAHNWERSTFGKTMAVEWACFNGNVEWLDGPGREAMGGQMGGVSTNGGLHGMQSDAAGNLYMCDLTLGMVRVWRRSDGRVLTIAGNGHTSAGATMENDGPAYRLRLGTTVDFAVVGSPLDGKGGIYLTGATSEATLLRLFRNDKHAGMWWFERVAGGGNKTPVNNVVATEAKLSYTARPIATLDGKIGVFFRSVGSLYWLRDGRLVQAYDRDAVAKAAFGGLTPIIYGIDGAGNFVLMAADKSLPTAAGNHPNVLATVSADGKVVRKLNAPNAMAWGAYPDRKREQWYVHSMDESGIHRFTPDGKSQLLLFSGEWHDLKPKGWGAGLRHPDEVAWFSALPLQDGRMAGWNTHGCLPVFIGEWIDKE